MKEVIAYCTKCGHANLYIPKNVKQKNPRMYCDQCKKQFPVGKYLHKKSKKSIEKSNFVPPQTKITPPTERVNGPSPILASMTDNELARHRLRMILTDANANNREVLDAVGKMTNYLDKAGVINIEEQSEKEVIDKFRQQSTSKLVNILKEHSQKELS